jgi:hypothetical protein
LHGLRNSGCKIPSLIWDAPSGANTPSSAWVMTPRKCCSQRAMTPLWWTSSSRASRRALGNDQEKMSRALTVLEQAKEVLKRRGPEGLDPKVVLAAALLGGLDPANAREVMDQAGLHWESADRVEALLKGQDPESQEALVREDAQRLADLPDPEVMATAAGRELAQALAARAAC